MDVLYRLGRATAAEVMQELSDPPTYSAVRATLRILGEKRPGKARRGRPALRFSARGGEGPRQAHGGHLVSTFFDGSPEAAMATLLDESASKLSDADFERLKKLIDEARTKGDRE